MIDLRHTRAGLLAAIAAPDPAGEPFSDIADSRVAAADVRVHMRGHSRDDLFPILELALSERFAAVPRAQLIHDLLMPLKHCLGNAHKHGNARDPAKVVSVEVVFGARGALIAVSDEGAGFDVAGTLRRLEEKEPYYENAGTGLRNLHRATSAVSYENGGRTVLLCFRPDTRLRDPAGPADAAAPQTLDAEWVHRCLSAEVPELGSRIESCRVYAASGPARDQCGHRYLLRVGTRDGVAAETRIVTGRLHRREATARHDWEVARRLHEASHSWRVRVPRPVTRPASEPRLVFYDFDPWMNLWEYLAYRRSLKALRRSAERIGQALASLHRSQIQLPVAPSDPEGDDAQRIVARAEIALRAQCAGGDVERFRRAARVIQEGARSRHRRPPAPTHGAFGWDRVHYGINGRFYLYSFEICRPSDPGLDLGGFAADLLCFTLADAGDGAYRTCEHAFLATYNADAQHPMEERDLPFYVGLALCQRLQRAELRTGDQAARLLAALEVALQPATIGRGGIGVTR